MSALPQSVPDIAELPLRMAASPLSCSRCHGPIMAPTWHVHQDGAVCPDCAVADPTLWIWQHLCDVCERIDNLMVAADNAEQRKLLAALIAQEAPHFAQWRDAPSTEGGPA